MRREMAWTRVVAPAEELLTVAEAKAHLRVENTEEDALIGSYVAAACQWCEEFTSRALLTQTWELHLPGWPWRKELRLPRPPLQSVTWARWTDDEDVEQTLDDALYHVHTASEPGRILLHNGVSWPGGTIDVTGVSVRYVAGFGGRENAPPAIVQAARILVGHFYENRESVVVGSFNPSHVPDTVRALLWPWRVW